MCVRCRGVILFSKVIGSIYDEYFGFVHASSSNQLKKKEVMSVSDYTKLCLWWSQVMCVLLIWG